MSTNQKSLVFTCEPKTSLLLAAKLADAIKPPHLIELIGDLGGGKTTFVKALGKALGITQTITSPTFNIHRSYEYKNGVLEHFDLYRLANDEIVLNELYDCLNNPKAIVVVEWAQNFKNMLSDERLIISFEYVNDKTRKLTFSAQGIKSQNLLEVLK